MKNCDPYVCMLGRQPGASQLQALPEEHVILLTQPI
jgi:hypothetical protein